MITKAKPTASWQPTEKVWLVLIPSLATVMLAAITVVGQYLATTAATNAATKAAAAAVKVEEVKSQLETSTSRQDAKLDQIHTLANGAMGAQLRAYADLTRWKADTTKDAGDIAAADKALQMFQDHEKSSRAARTQKDK